MNRGTAEWISTVFFIGKLPLAPGTWCSLIATGTWFFFFRSELVFLLPIAVLVIFFIGVYASDVLVHDSKEQDPPRIVIDEWAGQWICFIGIPIDWKFAVSGFILFRIFDILKPPPVRNLESLSGGWGIMADDAAAGVLTVICLQGYRFIFT
ncbi:MAG: phosphatidylglycerophosphatase A [Fidelibacterota bacterium]